MRSVRHWLAGRVHAHALICYLAYLLQYRLRATEFTAESALLELGTMYEDHRRDTKRVFKISRVVTLTKKTGGDPQDHQSRAFGGGDLR